MIQQIYRHLLEKKKEGINALCGTYSVVLFDTNSVYSPFNTDLYFLTKSPINTNGLLKFAEVIANFTHAVKTLGNLTTIGAVYTEINKGMNIVASTLSYCRKHSDNMKSEHPYTMDAMNCVIKEYSLLLELIEKKKTLKGNNGESNRIAKNLAKIISLAKYPEGAPSPSETDYLLVGELFRQLMQGKKATLISNDNDISGTIITGAAAIDFCGLAPAGGSFEETMQKYPINHTISREGEICVPNFIQKPEASATFETNDKKSIEDCISQICAINRQHGAETVDASSVL